MSKKKFIALTRTDKDKNGKPIPIYRFVKPLKLEKPEIKRVVL